MALALKGFYFITDAGLSRRGNLNDVKKALSAGVKIVQYRNKTASTQSLYLEARKLRRICRKVIFIVNDRLDIAQAVNADGLHLGNKDLPYKIARKILGKDKIIGLTVQSLKEAKKAARMKADYLGVGPIFATKTKPDAGRPLGVDLIRKIKESLKIPLFAIGGINLKNAKAVVASGADGLCAVSALVAKPDVKKEIEKFQRLFKEQRKNYKWTR